ncbi:MAG: outer membrane beta-barrel protein [Muribaculaceae bacterium]|nr:outer membrane beta-barrel protein [Muribaculaceae bacterium]MBR1725606.1 outer membrane beta-barrel protein [Muribaculaceae bacterium]
MKKLFVTLVVTAMVATVAFAQDAKSYRGFTDLSYTLGVGDTSEDFDRFTLSTTHGYQLDDMFFVGAGLSFEYVRDAAVALVPIYADVRMDIPLRSRNIKPFVDAKVGYAAGQLDGFYFAPTVGVRVPVRFVQAMNFGLGYKLQKIQDAGTNTNAITFNVGIEF